MSRLLGDWYSQTGLFGTTRLEDSFEQKSLLARLSALIRNMLRSVADWWRYDVGTPRDGDYNSRIRELLGKSISDLGKQDLTENGNVDEFQIIGEKGNPIWKDALSSIEDTSQALSAPGSENSSKSEKQRKGTTKFTD